MSDPMPEVTWKQVFWKLGMWSIPIVTTIGLCAGAYVFFQGITASMDRVVTSVEIFSREEKLRDTDWLARESAEHKRTEGLVTSVRDYQGEILQRLASIDEKTDTLISQHERRFEELENGQKDIVNQIRDSSLGIALAITGLAHELGVYQGHHDNDIHPDTGTHP